MKNDMYHKYASLYAEKIEDNVYNAKFERPSLLKMLPEVQGKSVLDMGCGPGMYAQHLLGLGAQVTAIDQSEAMVALTAQRVGDAVHCEPLDIAEGLPIFSDQQFDVVISPLVIHYVLDWYHLFQEVARVLKPGGLFLFSTHHPFCDAELPPSENYFATEKITEQWNTIDRPVEVSFYRRPLVDIFKPIASAGLMVVELSEGYCSSELQSVSDADYQRLSTKPNFIFIKCFKP